ncbi:hypothetical protein HGP16_25455 [Rhizobium sp. P40RR-XXII]|uniref:spike base protein, RCAP_Rcc01079 family n=1 Tax=Rhizobium sp. P40RR-XXII TaxID=2726739 RepID=UPI001456A95B|nr:hypothetical protein [Rhizobium sp. P40RR-XXII]NLS19889.1 hypothetical protein [Rhizobium sp. P40RR-XXII]
MAGNPISRSSVEWIGPAATSFDITPHATNTFTATRKIICAAGGTLAVRFANDAADRSLTLLSGVEYNFSIVAVRVTGTSATGIVGMY